MWRNQQGKDLYLQLEISGSEGKMSRTEYGAKYKGLRECPGTTHSTTPLCGNVQELSFSEYLDYAERCCVDLEQEQITPMRSLWKWKQEIRELQIAGAMK